MAEYLIQEETLTNLGDKIRVLNGTEESMTPAVMNSELASANDEVDTQSALIDQLSEMLDGKASSDGNIMETCNVTFQTSMWAIGFNVIYTDEEQNLQEISIASNSTITISTPKNSLMYINTPHITTSENIVFVNEENTCRVAVVTGDATINDT